MYMEPVIGIPVGKDVLEFKEEVVDQVNDLLSRYESLNLIHPNKVFTFYIHSTGVVRIRDERGRSNLYN